MLIFHLIALLAKARRVETTLGIVADFCPFCHTARAFKIKRIASKQPFSTGQGKLLDHEIECTVCGVRLRANPLAYESFEPKNAHPRDLQALIQSTYPQFWQTHASRLAFEDQLRKSPHTVPPASRAQWMMELFRLFDPLVQLCYKNSFRFDWQVGACLAATIAIFFALVVLSTSNVHHSGQLEVMAFCALGAGFVLTLVLALRATGWYFRKKFLPILARGLAPFEPIPGELGAVLAKCKSTHLMIGRKIKLNRLVAAINQADAESDPDRAAPALRPPADMAQYLKTAPNPVDDRAKRIVQPFHLYNKLVEDFYSRSTHFDKPATIGCLGTVVCGGAIFTVAFAKFANSPLEDRLCGAAVCVFVAGTIYTIVQLTLAPARYTKKIVVAKLADALRPLDPTGEEIMRALEKCRIAGMLIGKKVKPGQIMTALKATPTEGNQ